MRVGKDDLVVTIYAEVQKANLNLNRQSELDITLEVVTFNKIIDLLTALWHVEKAKAKGSKSHLFELAVNYGLEIPLVDFGKDFKIWCYLYDEIFHKRCSCLDKMNAQDNNKEV